MRAVDNATAVTDRYILGMGNEAQKLQLYTRILYFLLCMRKHNNPGSYYNSAHWDKLAFIVVDPEPMVGSGIMFQIRIHVSYGNKSFRIHLRIDRNEEVKET